jgi:RNase H-fold protein (predicted Holliday junction resolvase)
MSEKKTIYKARYVIDIEVEELTSRDGTYIEGLPPKMEIKPEIIIRDIDPLFPEDSEMYDHVEKHFPDEIEHLFARLYLLEGTLGKIATDLPSDKKSIVRQKVIEVTKQWIDKRARKRFPVARGPKHHKTTSEYESERNQFISEIVERLKNEDKGISKEKYAAKYVDHRNPTDAFEAKLRRLKVSWKDLKKNYINFT